MYRLSAFVCEKGLFTFQLLPMGLVNSPATYQRLIEQIMSGVQYETCLIYLDDIIVYSKTFEDHIQRLDEVLTRISNANLKFASKKCYLFSKKLNFSVTRCHHKGSLLVKIKYKQ